ncbi:FadR/GntR family transcriptional regulator [Sphingomonas tabacisoli]|uniref:FadR/GntR family transcriptional regulator n=1 Tax=Sphingomonas tabacisoli TaxID=2249466 RepID=A0ABW4I2Z6_9SPHN
MAEEKPYEPAHRLVARAIGTPIVTGHRPPGEILAKEVELAQQFGLSRSVIREALATLAAKGLIESRPRAGTRVRSRSAWNLLDPDVLAWMFEGAPPLSFIRSLFQLRLIIEPAAAELAATERRTDQLARMRDALDAMARYGLAIPEGQAADQEFHRALLDGTANELLVSLGGGIAAAVRWTTFFKYRTNRHPRDPIPQHRLLFDAIARSDGPAAREAAVALIRQAQFDTEAALGA